MDGDDRACGTYVEYIQGNKPLHGVQKHPLGEWADLRAQGSWVSPSKALPMAFLTRLAPAPMEE